MANAPSALHSRPCPPPLPPVSSPKCSLPDARLFHVFCVWSRHGFSSQCARIPIKALNVRPSPAAGTAPLQESEHVLFQCVLTSNLGGYEY